MPAMRRSNCMILAAARPPFVWARPRPKADCRPNAVEVRLRLTAAGQVLQPNDSRRRNLPFVILRGDRPLHLQQPPFNSDGPH